MDRFNHKKLNEVESKDQYRVEISNRFSAWKNLDAEVNINKVWETVRKNIKLSAKYGLSHYELKGHR
jgi:hypothetical protein